ncbi:M23 family metallopeptidase [Leptobacterium sp. I13]|uniref:M23 family metallopeptidase n=1 Tax=Leptobacterium meishanense TaxID=3128904 RepID=UPI0030EC3100
MRFLVVLWLFFYGISWSQGKYPQDLFDTPLDIPVLLSGTFGELRPNHFHSGIDIKTQQREGLSVKAIANGYISRIKVSPWGFGKAVYITHENGTYTSVYAHLQKFSPEIESYIKALQYKKQSYEVEVYPNPEAFSLEKGVLIGYSGNTGGSQGPHLHFEIRDAAQKPLNPLLFGISVDDSTVPIVSEVYGYTLNESAQINQSNKKVLLNLNKQPDGSFLADKIYAEGKIGFGINTYDRQDLTINKNGVYAIKMTVNGTTYFSYDFETFSFNETRYINTLIDYSHYKTYKDRVQKLFANPPNPLSIYDQSIDDGIITVSDGFIYNVEIEVLDFHGNQQLIKIPVEGKKQTIVEKENILITDHFLRAAIDNSYDLDKASVFFPANTFYENFYINIHHTDSILTIHDPTVPAHKNFTVTFDISDYLDEEKQQLFIARLDEEEGLVYEGNSRRGNTISAKTRNLGQFIVTKDTIPPVVLAENFKKNQWLNNYRYLTLTIEDEQSGINDYTATIDDKWVLMEYEPKNNTLTYDFNDAELKGNKHLLKVVVVDNVGNSTTFNHTFFKKD